MLADSCGFLLIFLITLLAAITPRAYMKRVYAGEKSLLDFLKPIEKLIFKICGADPAKSMNWKQYLFALLTIQVVWVVPAFIMLMLQGKLFLNPAHVPGMEWSLALNSAVSFLTSTNLQHYSGESGASYLSQMTVFMFLQFVSAATSLSAGIAVARGLGAGTSSDLGNFYKDFVRSLT